jgi:dTDP-4-amino-4,6-dideoxygalactose transaminase
LINVTKTFSPPLAEYVKYLEGIWERGHFTNHGPLVNELEEKLKEYFGVKYFYFVNNGTIAIQIAIKALGLKGEIITTPFSYVATTSSIVWENAIPVFADICPKTFTIDANEIEKVISEKTSAILATHVYGFPCEVEKINKIAQKHKLKVIYDAAHAFGVKIKDKSILNYGDISTLSFHATKLFHTIEGGGIATNDSDLAHTISYMRNFGHKGQEDFWGLGINGKSSEVHAAMGLCLLPRIADLIQARKERVTLYTKLLKDLNIVKWQLDEDVTWNNAYYPVIFETEKMLITVRNALNAIYIYPRRYFYPSLTQLNYVNKATTPISDDLSKRVLCLPLYYDLPKEDIRRISEVIHDIIRYSK